MSEAAKQVWYCSRCLAIYRKDFPFCPADGGEVVAAKRDPLIGQTLDHYIIDALIGEGAMGRVYRAHHTQLTERVYAVKVLIGDLAATQEARMRFVNEAKSASRLSHPNVVSVVDVGRSSNGLLYLVMELVDGTPLSELIGKRPMDPLRAARLIRDVCRGLAHAHDKGLVHRDLKPENVLVVDGPDGEVPRIVDFGIALLIDRDGGHARLTATGMALGTPAYVAPEQVSSGRVDARADQYSIGVTLFEMLSGGALPFVGKAHEVIRTKSRNEAPSLEDAMPPGTSAPPGLVRMVERMLARKPSDRYASIHDIVRMLTRYIDAPTTVILDDGRRSRAPAYVAALAALVIGGGALAWSLRDPVNAAVPIAAIAPAARSEAAQSGSATEPTRLEPAPVEALEPAPVEPTRLEPAPVEPPRVEPAPVEPTRVEPAPPSPARRRTRAQRARKGKSNKPEVAAAIAPAPSPVLVAPPPPSPAPPPPRPVPPSLLPARVDVVNVSGAISHTDVQRAMGRIASALGRCTAASTHVARVRFRVDDSRRARDIRASGAPSSALACLTSAVRGLRTESAPDVGDAEVVVQIGFR